MYLKQTEQKVSNRQSSEIRSDIQFENDQIMEQKNQKYQIQSTIYVHNYVLYSLSNIFITLIISSIGPLIPYLSQYQQKHETAYISLFSFRAFGSIIASIYLKAIQSKLTLHNQIIFGTIITSFSLFAFDIFYHIQIKGICIFFIAIGCFFMNIGIKLSALECYKDDSTKWIQIIQGLSGIGYLFGPIIVYFMQIYALSFTGFFMIFSIFLYMRIVSPQNQSSALRYFRRKQQILRQKKNDENDCIKQLPRLPTYLLSFILFFSVGLKHIFGGWISSYIVMNNFTQKQQGIIYNLIYYISSMIFLFLMLNINEYIKCSTTIKIQYLSFIGIINSILSYYLIYCTEFPQKYSLCIISILFGISNSAISSLLYYIPIQYQYNLTQKIMRIFMINSALGEGILTYIVGIMMSFYGLQWFIYGMGIGNGVIVVIAGINWWMLQSEKIKNSEKQIFNEKQIDKMRKCSQEMKQNRYVIKSGMEEKIYFEYQMVEIKRKNRNTNKSKKSDEIYQNLLII